MAHNNATHDSTVTGINKGSGVIHVPAREQREQGICIGTLLEVTISNFPHHFVDEVSFEGKQVAGDSVTVPAKLMRLLDLQGGESVTASFEVIEEDVEDETDEESLGDSKGGVDDEEDQESLEDLFEDVMSDEEDDEPDEEEYNSGLGELFN